MLDSFPTCKFAFASREIMLVQNVISGGVSLAGDETMIATDGGGRWQASYQNAPLNRRDRNLAWRAARANMEGGIRPIIFSICDARHQPLAGKVKGVPHSDGTPFDDATLYEGAGGNNLALVDAPLRSTTIFIDATLLERELEGGERFSIDHPTWRHRLYEVKKVEGSKVEFRPPLREAVTAGTDIEFRDPKCVMRLTNDMSAPLDGPRWATGSISLIEDMTGNYD